VARAQAPSELGDLVRGQAGHHARLQLGDRVAVGVEQRPARRRERHQEPPPVGHVAPALDEAAVLEDRDHVRHRLRRDERVAGKLRGRHVVVALQHCQRRVLQRGQPGGPHDVVQPGARRQFDLFDQVEKQRLGPRGRESRHMPVLPARRPAYRSASAENSAIRIELGLCCYSPASFAFMMRWNNQDH
jgi:hypothetical protein